MVSDFFGVGSNTGPQSGPYAADGRVGDPLVTRLATAGHARRFVQHAMPDCRPRTVYRFIRRSAG